MGEVLPLMTLATEIAAHSGCIIYDALFLALAESEELHPASHLCLVV
jgi:predicted nucleic acid-binding protein